MQMNNNEITAAQKVLEYVNIPSTEENIKHYSDCGYLTINHGNDGQDYCWYMDENDSYCVCVETLEEVNPESVGLY